MRSPSSTSSGRRIGARANAAEGEYQIPDALRKHIARDRAIDRELYEYARRLVAGRSAA